uniref:Uncharacterized protein n=1 Tax=Ceratitis capitata TaxID=7213 RepID=W8CC11_CERCA
MALSNLLLQTIKASTRRNSPIRTMAINARNWKYRAACAGDEVVCVGKNVKETKSDAVKCENEQPQHEASMWLRPIVYEKALPRLDELHYKPSDIGKRTYMRTWEDYPQSKEVPKKILCFENVAPPPFERRERNDRPKTACLIPNKENQARCTFSKKKSFVFVS